MTWRRLDPAVVVEQIRADCQPGDEDSAAQALAHLRGALLSGLYVAFEDTGSGRTFIGTEAEAIEVMMAQSDA